MEKFAVIIPAAGTSNRKGQFAPLLPLGERTVIETIVRSVQEAAPVWCVCPGHRVHCLLQPQFSADKSSGRRIQRIDVPYNFIGEIDFSPEYCR